MTDQSAYENTTIINASLPKRYAQQKRFKLYGMLAIGIAVGVLALLLSFVVYIGKSAFEQTTMTLDVSLSAEEIDANNLEAVNYTDLVRQSLRDQFPEVTKRRDKRDLYGLISTGAEYELRDFIAANPELIGTTQTFTFLSSSDVDIWVKSDSDAPSGRVKEHEVAWIKTLQERDIIGSQFNRSFFQNGDSREPEQAGVWGAIVGSFFSMIVCLILAAPLGVFAAIYLEELAPKNRFTRLIEVNINNLAAVPSIIFGILGLAVFLNFFGLPRSAPLVGGIVLALMTLPTVVIASRAALQAVPPSIREAALGIGANRIQMIFHHVLPLAMPGILTGTIIGMAQALGETAPLLMIGMVAFIADVPQGITDPAAALPVQVYLWADSPERGFVEKTGAAIMVLLGFLLLMNGAAIYLRKKFEIKW